MEEKSEIVQVRNGPVTTRYRVIGTRTLRISHSAEGLLKLLSEEGRHDYLALKKREARFLARRLPNEVYRLEDRLYRIDTFTADGLAVIMTVSELAPVGRAITKIEREHED